MKKFWVLVANSSYAHVLEVKGLGREISIIEKIPFPDGRKRDREIDTDRPGRSFDSMGHNRHGMSSRDDPHEHELKLFAHQLGAMLHKAKSENRFDEFAVIAPPHFLGELMHTIADPLKSCLVKKVDKDIPEAMNEKDRFDAVAKYLDLWNR